MEIKRINPLSLYRGVPYDYAVLAPAGGVVFTAGACPLDSDGEIVASGDLDAQTGKCLDNLEAVLTEAGSGFEQVLKTTVYVVADDRSELVRAWKVVEQRFGRARPPSTLLGLKLLGYPDQLVEIEAIALVPLPTIA